MALKDLVGAPLTDFPTEEDYALLKRIESPADLRKLPVSQLPEVCRELRAFMLESVSRTGGHLSSSLGATDIAVALHYVFNTPQDSIIWDVGHQAYAHKILTGRREAMKTLRKKGGISGFPKRSESPYDAFGTAHSSTSISAALGMAIADKLAGRSDRWHIAVIGDGALTGGMAVEALNHAGVYKEGLKLLIIVNDNDCSISPPAGALSGHLAKLVSSRPVWKARELSKSVLRPLPRLWDFAKRMEKQAVNFLSPPSSLFSNFDLNYFGPFDGHDVEGLVGFLKNLKNLDCPAVLHLKTRKGMGYVPAMNDPTLYHGVSPFDPKKGIVKKPADPAHPTYTQVFSHWICDMAAADEHLYAITPAMREGSGLVEFEKKFPTRYSDVAIAEQHAVTFAAGLSCQGMHPVVAVYSTFAQRAFDQVVHDVALQNLPVMFAIDRGGIVGADGATHQGAFDIAFLRMLPNMTVMTPSDENECRKLLTTAYRMATPAAVRYPRGKGPGVEIDPALDTVEIGKSRTVLRATAASGRRVAILAFGSMVWRLEKMARELGATLIDMRFVKPMDVRAVLDAAKSHDLLVTAEEGVIAGGAGSAVMELLAAHGVYAPVLQIGIPDHFVDHGDVESLFADCGMDPESVREKIGAALVRMHQHATLRL
ncbi:MAG: 1-deoxy-D-xylulose-5-phosphate synthase [Duodenibacillus sp.]|nr:1-deoxy-D-xylulose-5-phosphate synthase [Duodenibacillus sp.]